MQVWAPSLTAHNERRLEGIQRRASAIISKRKSETLNYSDRIGRPSLLSLKERRKNIIRTFSVKLSKNSDFQYLFQRNNARKTRNSIP